MSTWIAGFGQALRPDFPFEVAHREGGRLDFFCPPWHRVLSVEPRTWPSTVDEVCLARGPELDHWWVQSTGMRTLWLPGWTLRQGQGLFELSFVDADDQELAFTPPSKSIAPVRPEATGVTHGYPWFEFSYEGWCQRWHTVAWGDFMVKLQYRQGRSDAPAASQNFLASLAPPTWTANFERAYPGHFPIQSPFNMGRDGLTVVTLEAVQALDESLLGSLNLALDPLGATCAAWVEGPAWKPIWFEHLTRVRRAWADRHCVLIGIGEERPIVVEVRSLQDSDVVETTLEGTTCQNQLALISTFRVFGSPDESWLWLNLPAGPKRLKAHYLKSTSPLLVVLEIEGGPAPQAEAGQLEWLRP